VVDGLVETLLQAATGVGRPRDQGQVPGYRAAQGDEPAAWSKHGGSVPNAVRGASGIVPIVPGEAGV
jgi:hypothetical protein